MLGGHDASPVDHAWRERRRPAAVARRACSTARAARRSPSTSARRRGEARPRAPTGGRAADGSGGDRRQRAVPRPRNVGVSRGATRRHDRGADRDARRRSDRVARRRAYGRDRYRHRDRRRPPPRDGGGGLRCPAGIRASRKVLAELVRAHHSRGRGGLPAGAQPRGAARQRGARRGRDGDPGGARRARRLALAAGADGALEARYRRRVQSVGIQSFQVVRAEQIWVALRRSLVGRACPRHLRPRVRVPAVRARSLPLDPGDRGPSCSSTSSTRSATMGRGIVRRDSQPPLPRHPLRRHPLPAQGRPPVLRRRRTR